MITRITGMDLARIVTSEEFLTRLRDSSRITAREYNEVGFWVNYNLRNGKHKVSEKEVGSYRNMRDRDGGREGDCGQDEINVLHHHFHPEFAGPCVPSGIEDDGRGDLSLLVDDCFNQTTFYDEKSRTSKLMWIKFVNSIGKVRRDGSVELLFYQGRSYEPLKEGAVELIDEQLEEFFLGKGLLEDTEEYIVNSG